MRSSIRLLPLLSAALAVAPACGGRTDLASTSAAAPGGDAVEGSDAGARCVAVGPTTALGMIASCVYVRPLDPDRTVCPSGSAPGECPTAGLVGCCVFEDPATSVAALCDYNGPARRAMTQCASGADGPSVWITTLPP